MNAIATVPMRPHAPPALPGNDDLPDLSGLSLRIFETIEPGYGVVPITGDDAGCHMLHRGDVAVYDHGWHHRVAIGEAAIESGLYCLERQRAPSWMPNSMVAERFAANDPVRFVCEREVVFVFRDLRRPEHWAYRQLRSRLHRGVRVTARTEGPIYDWAIRDMMLGPIVGVFRPRIEGAA